MQTDFTPDYDLIFFSQSETLIDSDGFIGSLIRTKLLSEVRIARYLIFCVMFCRLLLFPLSLIFFWPLYCLSFYLWLLITHLVSSNASYEC
jgi:hypothetical protein